jgi:signal transduction histidine kinase
MSISATSHQHSDAPTECMPKQVSALNTYLLIQYMDEHHSDLDLELMIKEISQTTPCRIENLQTAVIEDVTLEHLRSTRYWFSNQFVKAFHEKISTAVSDPRLGFRIGSLLYKTQPLIRTAILIPFLGPRGIAKRVSIEPTKFNRTKAYQLLELTKKSAIIRITHNPDIDTCNFAMQWNAGCMASYARLTGATNVTVDLRCVDFGTEQGGSIWDFSLRFTEPPLLTRLAKGILFSIPWFRQINDRAELIEADHIQQIIDRDAIIRERTDHLVSIQRQLIDQERKSIEQKMQFMSMELVATEERERKAIAEDLHDSVTQLLAISLKTVKKLTTRSDTEDLTDIREHLEEALTDLRSLTFQISPPVLYDFGLEAAIAWLVEDINQRHAMRLIFSNLLDAPLNPTHQEKVTLYRAVRELVINMVKHACTDSGQVILRGEENTVLIEVADEGVGFAPDSVKRGFGLYSLKDRLSMLNGDMEIMSVPGDGTVVLLSVPLDCSFAEEAPSTVLTDKLIPN